MVSDAPGNKRLFSNMDAVSMETGNIDLSELTKEELRDYVRENKAPSTPHDFVLVSSKWYENFMDGEDSPLIMGKGAAGEKMDSKTFEILKERYGVDANHVAFRCASLKQAGVPFKIINLSVVKSVGEEFSFGSDAELWIVKIYSQFVSEADVSNNGRTSFSSTTNIGAIDLLDNESLVVVPVNESPLGHVGLSNMGNTCFMNSSLQALLHIPELIYYFISGDFKHDLNRSNPIGCHGKVADAFADLFRQMYGSRFAKHSFRPTDFLRTIGQFNRAFASRMQQDSQEFTAFLLDGLHEDLNRVVNKPSTEKPELPDNQAVTDEAVTELAKKSWDIHKLRNDSKIIELFTGMYKSTLVCPECDKVSITFDPYFDITLPLPSSAVWMKKVMFVPWVAVVGGGGTTRALSSIQVALRPTNTVLQMKQQVAKLSNVDLSTHDLLVGDVYGSKFYRLLKEGDTLADSIEQNDEIVIYEAPKLVDDSRESRVPVYPRFANGGCGLPFFVHLKRPIIVADIQAELAQHLAQLGYTEPASKVSINYFDGDIDELVYGYGGSRLRPLWVPPQQPHPHTEEDTVSHTENSVESFVSLQAEQPDQEELEKLPTPAASPDFVAYSPVTAPVSTRSSSISSVTDSSEAAASDRSASAAASPAPASSSSSSSSSTSPSASSIYDLGRASAVPSTNASSYASPVTDIDNEVFKYKDLQSIILVIDLNTNFTAPSLDSLPAIENPAAVEAHRALNSMRSTTLDDCLRSFVQPEVLSEDDLWYCPRCKDFRQAQKQIELWKTPDVLMVHLKRFSGIHNISRKINDLVEFPLEDLDLSNAVSDSEINTEGKEGLVYDLIAVDNHYGGMGGGHYTSYVKDPFTGEWLDFNDSYVSAVNSSQVCTNAAYLLFYRKRTTAHRSIEETKQMVASLRSGGLSELPQALSPPHCNDLTLSSPEEPHNASSIFTGEGRRLGSSDGSNEETLPWANL